VARCYWCGDVVVRDYGNGHADSRRLCSRRCRWEADQAYGEEHIDPRNLETFAEFMEREDRQHEEWQKAYKKDRDAFLASAGVLGSTEIFKKQLDEEKNRENAENEAGETVLMFAARSGVERNIQLLIERGAEVNAIARNGWTALHFAADAGHHLVADLLIGAGARVDTKLSSVETPLMLAAKGGHINVLRVLLQAGAAVNLALANGWTSIHFCARYGNVEVLPLLLQAGADVEAKTTSGWTPLHVAVAAGKTEIVKSLLVAGARIDEKTHEGWTPLGLACRDTDSNLETIRFLMSKGADIEAAAKDGWRPLHSAAKYGHFHFVKELLAAGANLHGETNEGLTPLGLACRETDSDLEIISFLISKEADVEAANGDGWRPLHFASKFGQPECVRLLLEAGANVNAITNEGFTAIEIAIQNKRWPVVDYLKTCAKFGWGNRFRMWRGRNPAEVKQVIRGIAGSGIVAITAVLTINYVQRNERLAIAEMNKMRQIVAKEHVGLQQSVNIVLGGKVEDIVKALGPYESLLHEDKCDWHRYDKYGLEFVVCANVIKNISISENFPGKLPFGLSFGDPWPEIRRKIPKSCWSGGQTGEEESLLDCAKNWSTGTLIDLGAHRVNNIVIYRK